jgi:arylsulfatase A-like enzyme
MKPTRFHPFGRMLAGALLAVTVGLDLAAAPAQFVFTNAAPRPLPRRPSIILIVADGVGYGDLSCYGQTKFQTPNLDRLAAEGVRFTSYYAGDAESSPSRAALMLGRDSGHLKQRADADVPLAADDISVAQLLKQSGFHTGLIGEWDLGGDGTSGAPWNKGFDEFAGYLDPGDAENYYADFIWRYSPGSLSNPTNHPLAGYAEKEPLLANAGGTKHAYIPDLLTVAALNFIKNNQPDQFNRHRSFFLLLNYTTLRANTAEAARTGNGMQVPTDAPYSEESWPAPEKNQAAMLARLDADIGKILAQLKALNIESNTVVFFTSDTGPHRDGGIDLKIFQSAGPFRGGRGDLYEGGLRVPMIARWPGKIPAGRVSDFTWAAWDFLPTATDIALIKPPAAIDGISVLPALLGQTQTNQHETFRWELKSGRNVWHTVRQGDWVAVQSKAGAPPELYNLKSDPGETNNVADKNPDVIKRFKSLLKNN